MKASKHFINTLRDDFEEWYYSLDPAKTQDLRDHIQEHSPERVRWDIYWHLNALNDYPEEYTKGLKDNHIATALRRAFNLDIVTHNH